MSANSGVDLPPSIASAVQKVLFLPELLEAILDTAKAKREAAKAEERVRAHEEAGWGKIWGAFRKALQEAAARGESEPKWPEFLALNKSLAPPCYELSEVEAGAAQYPRRLTSAEDEAEAAGDSG